ncbi:hypothetical protein ABZU75_04085 [Streptosporangium sp. NPDC005286]|uniref:hypothetical protein n=1 Tax=Streptosporangium sp. NPDC005286 TaxID=3154463 RepID=UPI0033A6AD44
MSIDRGSLVVDVSGRYRVRLPLSGKERATRLVLYGRPSGNRIVYGLAVLDEGGRVMLDSPGFRSRHQVQTFAAAAGLASEYRRYATEQEAYAAFGNRARQWYTTAHEGLPANLAEEAPTELLPYGGALEGTPAPATGLTWDDRTLVATDSISGRSMRLAPAALYHYRYERSVLVSGKNSGKKESRFLTGLAVLDADGLVLADLPGEWTPPDVAIFAAGRGVPVRDALIAPPRAVRATLGRRAPGWTRLTGQALSRASRARTVATVCAGVAGLLAMAYIVSASGWFAWRGLSALGRALLDILDAKWLAVFFAPLLVVLNPARQAWHGRRIRRGSALGPPGGPYLSVWRKSTLRVWLGPRMVPDDIAIGPDAGCAAGLMTYRHGNLAGLFVTGGSGRILRHLPGPWSPEDAHRFATRHGLGFEARTLSREGYLGLTADAYDAVP